MSAAGWLHNARNRALRDQGVSADLYLEVITPLIETVEDLLEVARGKSHHRMLAEHDLCERDVKYVRKIIERRLR